MKQLLWIIGVLALLEICATAPANTRKDDDSLYSILKRLDTVLDDLLVKVEDDQEVHQVEQRNEDGALPEITELEPDKRSQDGSEPEFTSNIELRGQDDDSKSEHVDSFGTNGRSQEPTPEDDDDNDSGIRSPPTANIDDDDASLLQVLQWLQSMRSHRKETRGDHDIPFP